MVQTSRVQVIAHMAGWHGRGWMCRGLLLSKVRLVGMTFQKTMDSDVGTVVVRLSLEQGHVPCLVGGTA